MRCAQDESKRAQLRAALTYIPRIHRVLEIDDSPFIGMHDIFEQTLVRVKDEI
ncbi:hypothetical protein [Moraxella bovoculi]|uniref:hypothetical protein n=1 Tax=Moraxella bovoculi TaxID=386891 RepID=UPI001969A038|nr:hypothetical protein [Moraxella bovoculi]